MSDVIKLSLFEFRKNISSRSFLFSFLIVIFYSAIWIGIKPKQFMNIDYQFEFFRVLNFVILYYACSALGKEFSYGTSKIIFTGFLTRTQILVQKLLVIVQIGIFYWICSRLLEIIIILRKDGKFDFWQIINVSSLQALMIFLLVSFTVGTLCLLASIVTLKFNSTLIIAISIFGVFQYFMPLFYRLRDKTNLTVIEMILTKTPNYILYCWTEFWNLRIDEIIVMIVWGGLFLVSSIVLIKKRSIR